MTSSLGRHSSHRAMFSFIFVLSLLDSNWNFVENTKKDILSTTDTTDRVLAGKDASRDTHVHGQQS